MHIIRLTSVSDALRRRCDGRPGLPACSPQTRGVEGPGHPAPAPAGCDRPALSRKRLLRRPRRRASEIRDVAPRPPRRAPRFRDRGRLRLLAALLLRGPRRLSARRFARLVAAETGAAPAP